MTLILSNADVEKVLSMPECLETLEQAYREMAFGRGVSRTRSDTVTPTVREDALYSLKSMDGVVPSLGVGAVRINSEEPQADQRVSLATLMAEVALSEPAPERARVPWLMLVGPV